MKVAQILVSLIAAVSLQAAAECTAPLPPTKIPDGATASQEEMMAGVKEMKAYNATVTSYTECLDQETKDLLAQVGALAPTKESEARMVQIKNAQAKKQNAVVDTAQTFAAKFNEQIRAYKARQPKQ